MAQREVLRSRRSLGRTGGKQFGLLGDLGELAGASEDEEIRNMEK